MPDEQKIDDIVSSFRRIHHSFHQLNWQGAEEQNLTSTQLMVLRKLSQFPDIGNSELAEHMHLGNSAMSGIVDRMVNAGLVERTRSEHDRRSFKLRVTETGRLIRERSRQALLKRLAPLADLPESDVQELLRIHNQILAIIAQGRENKDL